MNPQTHGLVGLVWRCSSCNKLGNHLGERESLFWPVSGEPKMPEGWSTFETRVICDDCTSTARMALGIRDERTTETT